MTYDASALSPYPPNEDKSNILQPAISSLQVSPVNAINHVCDESWHVKERTVMDSMWYWIVEGTGKGYVGSPENEFTFTDGDLVIMPRGELQSGWTLPGEKLKLCAVHFYAEVFGSFDLCSMLDLRGVFSFPENTWFQHAHHEMARLHYYKPLGSDESFQALLTSVVLEVIRHKAAHPSPFPNTTSWRHLIRLNPVLQYIDDNLGNPVLTINELATVLHISEVALRRLFRSAINESPTDTIRRKRTERACLLLKTTDRELKDIAFVCGFASTSFFHKVFKLQTGMTPSQYRDNTAI